MFFRKNKCPHCGEVLDDDCYCFNCGTAIHNDEGLNDCEGTAHKKITYVSTKEAPRFIYGASFVLFLFYLMFLIRLILLIPILQPLFAYYICITFQCKKEV